VILAELELYHSRPIAPTRRVALGERLLPVDPPPGLGGILLGGVVASAIGSLDADLVPDLNKLLTQLEHGQRIPQPRLRYRFQIDRVGLQRSVLRLRGEGEELWFDFDGDKASPEQLLLGAAYAAGSVAPTVRPAVMATLRRAMRWEGPIGADLISSLAGFSKGQAFSTYALEHPVEWALSVLGFDRELTPRNGHGLAGANGAAWASGDPPPGGRNGRGLEPSRSDVQRRFRLLLRDAHPDHGGADEQAAERIADLTEARRILLGRSRGR
jgi:hypothetical protein